MDIQRSDIITLLKEKKTLSRTEIANILQCSEQSSRIFKGIIDNIDVLSVPFDPELIGESVKLAKQKQKFQDSNRIERKAFREYARVENAVSAYGEELVKLGQKFGEELKKIELPTIKVNKKTGVGVLHMTDWHGNELIDLPHNKFDFNILAKRAQKFAYEAKRYFKASDIKTVVIAATGDMLNSDRRLDELLNQATNRSKATFLVAHIIKHMIIDLRKDFNIKVVSVLGNESRVNQEMSFSNSGLSDNYDFVIFNHLRTMFEFAKIKGIEFGSIDRTELVVDICGQKWLLMHDLNKALNTQKDTQSTIGRYYLAGNPIDFILGGHIHAKNAQEFGARSSSIGGSNSYNEIALNLIGRASQNIFIVTKEDRNQIGIDLQNYSGFEGYPIIEELKAYNAKSLSKTHIPVTTFKVVI